MHDFKAIIFIVKEYLADGKKVKILDKDVADTLEISQTNFATIKRRNSIPYENILRFCKREGFSYSKIFFKN